jgi:hypothetical protein
MNSLPTTFEALEDAISLRCGNNGVTHATIIQGLVAVVRFAGDRTSAAPYSPTVEHALSILDAWLRTTTEEELMDFAEPLASALEALRAEGRDRRRTEKPAPRDAIGGLLCGTLQAARYDDHDDWPSEVVFPAIELLTEFGDPEPRAVQAVAEVLSRHGVI